jgi:transcriptional regulator with XRE-family HTH domain
MPVIQTAAVRRRRLRSTLRRWRRHASLSQQQAANAMGWSLSKLIRLENGTGRPIPGDVLALLTYYGAHPDECREFAAIARDLLTDASFPRERLSEIYNQAFINFLEFEQAASFERHWHCNLIPGLLQTEEYAREVLSKLLFQSPAYVDRALEARLLRQDLLTGDEGPFFSFLIDEAVFFRPVGSGTIMAHQLEHILRSAERARIEIGIVPVRTGLHPGMRGPFILLEFEDEEDDDVLYMETPSGDFFSRDDPNITTEYHEIFGQLQQVALPYDGMIRRFEQLLRGPRD